MGAQMVYLREPVTGKEVQDGGDLNGTAGLHYGISAMQGWRRNMEDAHLAVTELDDRVSLFGVFDGHGGRGVSRFTAAKLGSILKETEAYKEGDYVKALEKAFLTVDDRLREAAGRREIETLDRPDAGAVSHPMVVPRKILQKFLNNAAGQEVEDCGGEQQAAAERCPAASEGERNPQQEDKPAAAAEGTTEAEAADEAETEEEQAAQEAEGTTPSEEGTKDSEEEWDDDDMALVDPSRVTCDPVPEAQGCTAVVVLVVRREGAPGPRLYCANAGDSRAILSRRGTVVALSEDHKPENPGETARIEKAGGFVQQMPGGARVQGDLNLSRAIGDLRYKKPENMPPEDQIVTAFPEVRTFELTGEDEFIVLGCDGIWERTGNQEMVDFVRPRIVGENGKARSLSDICGEICDKGLCPSMDTSQNENFDGTGCDNMTVMIVQLKEQISVETRKRPAEEPEPTDGGAEGKKTKLEESHAEVTEAST